MSDDDGDRCPCRRAQAGHCFRCARLDDEGAEMTDEEAAELRERLRRRAAELRAKEASR